MADATSTTIRLEKNLKTELDELKNAKNESYAEVISRLVNIAKEDEELSSYEIKHLEHSLKDLKAGRLKRDNVEVGTVNRVPQDI